MPAEAIPGSDGVAYSLDYSIPDAPGAEDDEEVEGMFAAAEDCRRQHSRQIHSAWLQQHLPTEEEIQAAREALATCLREAGADVPAGVPDDFADWYHDPAFAPCSEQVSDEFGIPDFGG